MANKVGIFALLITFAWALCATYLYYTTITGGQELRFLLNQTFWAAENDGRAAPIKTHISTNETASDALMGVLLAGPEVPTKLPNIIQTGVAPKNQPALPRRTFWTSDLHDGTRVDTPSVLTHLNQTVIVNGHKEHTSYPAVLAKCVVPSSADRSPIILSHRSHSDYMSEQDIKTNFEFYKNSPLLAGADAFICSFPASFCEMWMPFNKSIVFLPAHRFSLARCSKAKLERLIQHLYAMKNSTSPKHFIAAAGVYDAEYINYYTGLKPVVLSTSSFFYAGRGVINYTQARNEILVGPLQLVDIKMDPQFKVASEKSANRTNKEHWEFRTAKKLYGHYHLQNVADHRAVVLMPYAVMSFGITELYAMAIPLLIPSKDMLIKNWIIADRTWIDYCGFGMKTQLPPKHPDSKHLYSPESYEHDAIAYWLQFADYFQWPYITVFNDFDDLIEKLDNMDFEGIHEKMVLENQRREAELLDRWSKIIVQIDTGRKVPNDYNQAIKALWNTDALQVE